MSDRRIVVCHIGGLRRIVGIIAGSVAPAQLPTALAGMVGGDMGTNHAVLGAVEPRYVMYREICPDPAIDEA